MADTQLSAAERPARRDHRPGCSVAGLDRGDDVALCLEQGSKASAIAVTRPGASTSIPTLEEVQATGL